MYFAGVFQLNDKGIFTLREGLKLHLNTNFLIFTGKPSFNVSYQIKACTRSVSDIKTGSFFGNVRDKLFLK